MVSLKHFVFINIFSLLFLSSPLLAKGNVECYNIKKGDHLDTEDFILEKELLSGDKVHKKIFMKQDGFVSKKQTYANSNYTVKSKNKLVISDDFLVDFILSTEMEENKVYQVTTDKGSAHFKIKSSAPPLSILEVETAKGSLLLNVQNDGSRVKVDKVFFEKSNLSLLPCDLDTKAKIFQNKDVNIFMGEKVAKVINK